MMNNKKFYSLAALALLLGAGLWLTGCESDTVAPHESLPELTTEDVAYQTAAMGAASARVLPQIVEFTAPGSKNEYEYTFSGDPVTGSVLFDFRTGGADGTSAPYNTADWGRMYTGVQAPLSFAVGIGGSVVVDFDIMASIVQATGTATLLDGSAGNFTAGDYTATFSFSGLMVRAGADYPLGGTMTFISGGHTMTMGFDGTSTATITFNGAMAWTVNLDDGSITEIT
jgi:hypothetical protein